MTTVRTTRLLLRVPESADAQPMMEIHQDPAVLSRIRFTAPGGGLVTAWRNVAYMVGHWQLRGFGEWTVIELATGAVVGRVGFTHPEGAPDVELGWIIRRERWGNGFATEAARHALRWVWSHTSVTLVMSTIDRDNAPSIRIAHKLGGTRERDLTQDGHDVVVYSFSAKSEMSLL